MFFLPHLSVKSITRFLHFGNYKQSIYCLIFPDTLSTEAKNKYGLIMFPEAYVIIGCISLFC